jgi:hypothetical protein
VHNGAVLKFAHLAVVLDLDWHIGSSASGSRTSRACQ